MPNKDILLVTSWAFPHVGGVSSHLQLLAFKLHVPESDVVSFRQICEEPRSSPRWFFDTTQKHIKRFLQRETISLYAKTLSSIISRKDFEIAHCHDAMATWAAWLAREKSNRSFKILSTVHGPVSQHMVEEGYPIDSADVRKVIQCEKEAWEGCDAIIAVDKTQAEIVKSQGAESAKISVIPNAVDLNRIQRTATELPISKRDDRPWIFVPRRLSPKNGVEFAIRAMTYITPRPLLLLAGNGHERKRLEELAIHLKLKEDVVFLGGLEHSIMIPLLAACDLVLIPSVPVHGIVEATSIAAIEAMGLGKPVIASAIGGLKELIRNGENGILVPPADSEELANSINNLFINPKAVEQIGISAKETVEKEFSVDLWFSRHMEIYASLFK